ncbi:MAG TPA: hypothetical protein PKX92_09150 [Edaphocola sp.]|nr:hypothetical protein [Edaphocola sp.]
MLKKFLWTIASLSLTQITFAQNIESQAQHHQNLTPAQKLISDSGEELLTKGNADDHSTIISGYGEMSLRRDVAYKLSKANLDRVVLFVGHQFSNRLSFFSELEVANARIEEGTPMGEVGMEQAFLRYNFNSKNYLIAGLNPFRLGITNEAHMPTDFYSSERPQVEQFVIPSTWRELGFTFYGQMKNLPLAYTIGISNGLDASKYQHGFGIGKGSLGGQSINANSMAVNASLRAFLGDVQAQVSGYYGGSIALSPYTADSLGVAHGAFAAPVMLAEANVQYERDAFSAKALGVIINNPEASEINTTFANNAPQFMYGFYGEAAFDFLYYSKLQAKHKLSLVGFLRYEKLNLNATIPSNGIVDGTLDQNHFIAGIAFFPTYNVVVKGDVRYTSTGAFNKNLMINPPPVMRPYAEKNYTVSLCIGYAF